MEVGSDEPFRGWGSHSRFLSPASSAQAADRAARAGPHPGRGRDRSRLEPLGTASPGGDLGRKPKWGKDPPIPHPAAPHPPARHPAFRPWKRPSDSRGGVDIRRARRGKIQAFLWASLGQLCFANHSGRNTDRRTALIRLALRSWPSASPPLRPSTGRARSVCRGFRRRREAHHWVARAGPVPGQERGAWPSRRRRWEGMADGAGPLRVPAKRAWPQAPMRSASHVGSVQSHRRGRVAGEALDALRRGRPGCSGELRDRLLGVRGRGKSVTDQSAGSPVISSPEKTAPSGAGSARG